MSDTPPLGPAHLLAPAIGYILNNSLGFTLRHNPEALSNSASTLILHLLFLGQNVSQHVLCVNHPHTHTCFTLERDLPCNSQQLNNSSQILCKLNCFCSNAWAKEKRFVKKHFLKLHFETQFLNHSGQMNVKLYTKSTQSKVRFFLEIMPSTKM